MDAQKGNQVIRIDLTPAQGQLVKDATGREAGAIELTLSELEERIAPRLALNCNETLLAD